MAASRVPRVVIFSCVLLPSEGRETLALGALHQFPHGQTCWFDTCNLTQTMTALTGEQPAPQLVCWDLANWRTLTAILRREAHGLHYPEQRLRGLALCEKVDALAVQAAGISQAVYGDSVPWYGAGAPRRSLHTLCRENGLPVPCAEIPELGALWQSKRRAEVMNALQEEMLLTSRFLAHLITVNGWLVRDNARIKVEIPQPLTHAVTVAQQRSGA